MRIFIVLFLTSQVTCGLAANILFTYTHFSESHKKHVGSVASILADRGHNVTLWNPVLADFARVSNPKVRDIMVRVTTEDQWLNDAMVHKNNSEGFRDLIMQKEPHYGDSWSRLFGMEATVCRYAFEQVPDAIAAIVKDTKWDLMVYDSLFDTCGLTFAFLTKTPHVSLSTMNVLTSTVEYRNMPYRYSTFPFTIKADYDYLSFTWRLLSLVEVWARVSVMEEGVKNAKSEMVQVVPQLEHFSLAQFERDALFTFILHPESLDIPKVNAPDIFYTGASCPKHKHGLPADLETFLEDPRSEGTIITGFGHWMHWEFAPEELIAAFVDAFRSLPEYRFVFHYNGEPIKNIPTNVYISDWFPQNQLLNHPRTKLFITHCGMKSSIEAVCSGVPIIAFPMFVEQPRNALSLSRHLQLGPLVSKFTVTSKQLVAAVRDAIGNPKYARNVEFVHAQISEPVVSAEYAIVWKFEFYLRHPYAGKLLALRAKRLGHLQLHSLDVILLFVVVIIFLNSLVALNSK